MIPNEKCYEIQNDTFKVKYFNRGFCVIGQNNETICPGDSGSPIIWEDPNDDNRAYLVGIASQKEPISGWFIVDCNFWNNLVL